MYYPFFIDLELIVTLKNIQLHKYFFLVFISVAIIALSSCDKKDQRATENIEGTTLFQLLDSSKTGVSFLNKVENKSKFNIFSYRNFYNGGGVGIIDINNDGLQDIYFTGNQVPNKLYLNKGNLIFEDITVSAGVEGNKAWSTGVTIIDINQDGFKDIYVCNAGYDELMLPTNELFINNGDNTFEEKAKAYGLDESGLTTHASFFDYDGDGDLDVYVLNNSFVPVNTLNNSNKRELYAEDWKVKDFIKGGGDKLLKNDNGVYKDVSKEAGIYGSLIGFGLGVTVGDVNNDNRPDIYVSNDFFERDYLYINQGNGTFSEEGKSWMGHMSLASMGADMADINNDGLPEIFTTEMLPETQVLIKQKLQFEDYNTQQLKIRRDFHNQFMHNALQLNTGENSFKEIAWYAGVAQSDWSWGALMFDADLDGYNDILVCNGIFQDVTDADFMDFFANDVVQRMVLTGKKDKMENILLKMPSNPQPNKLFINNRDLTFSSKEKEHGLGNKTFSNGAAYADLNNDGSLDLIINNLNQPSTIYRGNKIKNTHFLKVQLTYQSPNLDGIGSKIKLYAKGKKFYKEMIPSRGFQSSVDYNLHFGLGAISKIDSVEIIWPNKSVSTLYELNVDTLIHVNFRNLESKKIRDRSDSDTEKILQRKNSPLKAHVEDEHVDFYHEGLIMRMLSKEGPAMEVIDINKDGLDDVIIGGAKGQPNNLYLQGMNRSFSLRPVGTAPHEVTAIKCFDANNDGFLDIYFGHGGNHEKPSETFQDELWIQSASGEFNLAKKALPTMPFNTSIVLCFDYDNDNDLDLFVGSRSTPMNYGVVPKSYLLQNDGRGNFEDITVRRAPVLAEIGMVSDAKMADLDADGINELIIVGEWMGIEILENADKQLKRRNNPALSNLKGWWNTLEIRDLNSDGKPDFIVGNRGTNFFFNASKEQPVRLWLKDFDANGDLDKVMTVKLNGNHVPIHQKREMVNQVPSLKKQNLKYKDYSVASITDLFGETKIKDAKYHEANIFESIVALSTEKDTYTIKILPAAAQFSAVHAIHTSDFNGDGNIDIVLAGNENSFKPQFGSLDANTGLILNGQGNGEFKAQDYSIGLKGEVRVVKSIEIGGQQHLIFGINDNAPALFETISN